MTLSTYNLKVELSDSEAPEAPARISTKRRVLAVAWAVRPSSDGKDANPAATIAGNGHGQRDHNGCPRGSGRSLLPLHGVPARMVPRYGRRHAPHSLPSSLAFGEPCNRDAMDTDPSPS